MGKPDLPRLCIVSPYSYPLFKPECRSPFGGAEVRSSMIARGLAARGVFDVSMLVWDHGQPPLERIDGVTLYAWEGQSPPLKAAAEEEIVKTPAAAQTALVENVPENPLKLRAVWKKLVPEWGRALAWKIYESPRRLFQFVRDHPKVYYHPWRVAGFIASHDVRRKNIDIYQKINADLYMMAGNSKEAAELAFHCRKAGKKYVFLAAHDADYDAGYLEKPDEIGVWGLGHLMLYSIQNADCHIVQNEYQQKILHERYRRSAIVVRNPVDVLQRVDLPRNENEILWVGKSEWFKQPQLALKLAEACPEFDFTLILARVDPALHQDCLERVKALPNVTLLNYVPFQEIEKYFARARLFVNTSVFEGFPNTFLQAAKYNVPVVSLQVDAGEMLSLHGCGIACEGSYEKLEGNVRLLMNDEDLYREKSQRCAEYLAQHHNYHRIIAAYENALLSCLE